MRHEAHPGTEPADRLALCAALLDSWGRSQRVFNSRTVQDWYRSEVGSKYAELPERVLLTAIADLGPIRLTDLAEVAGRTVSNVSKAVNGLVTNGYVVRTIPDYDRRVTLLETTEHGRDVSQRIHDLDIEVVLHHVEPFDDDELSNFVAMLRQFADRIAEWKSTGLERRVAGISPDGSPSRNDRSRHPNRTSGGMP